MDILKVVNRRFLVPGMIVNLTGEPLFHLIAYKLHLPRKQKERKTNHLKPKQTENGTEQTIKS